MDSPHFNYPRPKTSSIRVSCALIERKQVNDSSYFLQHQTPFKEDAMTVAEVQCCIHVILVMYIIFK